MIEKIAIFIYSVGLMFSAAKFVSALFQAEFLSSLWHLGLAGAMFYIPFSGKRISNI